MDVLPESRSDILLLGKWSCGLIDIKGFRTNKNRKIRFRCPESGDR